MSLKIAVPAVLLWLYIHVVSAALPFRTIALSGQPAPGTPEGVVFSGFHRAGAINENGIVVFEATLSGSGVTPFHPSNAYGIWRDSAGVIEKFVRSGEQAVNLPTGVNYYLPGPPRIDGSGRTAFLAKAPGGSTHGVFSEGQGMLRLLGREGDHVPGQPAGVTFYLHSLVPLMNDVGNVAFTSFIQGLGIPFATEALFDDRSGQLELIIKDGDAAPGIAGATLLQIGSTPVLNDLGVIAFNGRYSGGTYPNDGAIWTEQSGAFTLLARSGQAPAGMPAGVVFGQLSGSRINNAGQVMFQSTLTGPGVSATNESTLWLHDGGEMQLIAREGSAAAGLAPGINYGGFIRAYLNGAGETTFTGSLVGADVTTQNDTALWSQRGDVLTLLAREGDPAPGAPDGVKFGDLSRLGSGFGFQVNNNGQVAFEVGLTGSGITTANDTGIWVSNLAGSLRLVTREGDLFDVNDDPNLDDLRTVAFTDLEWYSGGGEDGYGSSLNNSGELVIALSFTDLSQGAFVIDTAVPEPHCVLLFATGLPLMWMSNRLDARRRSMPKRTFATHPNSAHPARASG